MAKPRWKQITIAVAIILPLAAISDLGLFQLKHQALSWANGGRWCADVDKASGEVLDILYGDAACEDDELMQS